MCGCALTDMRFSCCWLQTSGQGLDSDSSLHHAVHLQVCIAAAL